MTEPATDQATVQPLLNQAVDLHVRGNLDAAKSLYLQLLALAPQHPDALHLLGVIATQKQEHQAAADLIGRAIALRSDKPAYHYNHAIAMTGLGLLDAALASYDQAIAIKPDYAEAWCNRGTVLQKLKRWEECVASLDRFISYSPNNANAHFCKGDALRELGQFEAALASYDKALAIDPAHSSAWLHRGNAQLDLKQFEAALASLERALAIRPDYAEAHLSKAVALQALRRLDAALVSVDRALRLNPEFAHAHNNKGLTLHELLQSNAAIESFDTALKINPDFVEAYVNRGVSRVRLRQPLEAVVDFEKALARRPDFPGAQWNMALALLQGGDFLGGWEKFEWRWKILHSNSEPRPLPAPLWLGAQPLSGKTILLHAEQGLGDNIQFCRYVPLVARLGAKVILEVPEPLIALLRDIEGVSAVVEQGWPLPRFDYHCPMMSLPLAFKMTQETIPFAGSYLRADASKVAHWRGRLGQDQRRRVGLVWHGGFRPDRPDLAGVNERRNIPVQMMAAFKAVDCCYVSLQKGDPAEAQFRQLQQTGWNGPQLLNPVDELKDFSDTAALICALDLVISVDTAVAHLAGALGKPVWLLNRFDSCWRWMVNRQDSPWYQSMRIFNQSTLGDWDGVIRDAVAALELNNISNFR